MSESSLNSSSHALRRWLLLGLALSALALLAWWLWPASDGKSPAGPQGAGARHGSFGAVPVRVGEVRQGDFPVELKALGTVTAYNTVDIRARVSGQVVKVLFSEGQEVKAGDLLAVIDPRPYEIVLQQAQGTLQQDRAQLKNAELDLARYVRLYAEDSVARQTLDTQRAQVAQLQGTVRSDEASVGDARLNLEFTRVRAPIDGRLGLRQVDIGNLVTSSDTTPLVTLTQTRPIAVKFTLPESELSPVLKRLHAGQQLTVEAWDRGERSKLAAGLLQSTDNQIDTTTGTLLFKARFENVGQELFPNQFVNVRLHVDTRERAILIPSAALQYGAKGTFVYVVGDDGKVQQRTVVVGPSDGATALIEEGLALGERLVLEGIDRLRDGAVVEIIDDQAASAAPEAETAAKPRA